MKVTNLHRARVDNQTIQVMEELLEKAKSGELASLVFIERLSNGDVTHGWSGRPNIKMLGEIENMKFNFISQMYFPVEEQEDE